MKTTVLIAHAPGDEELAKELGKPIIAAGYDVFHGGTLLIGDSLVGESSKLLDAGSPVVLCGTIRAVGTRWAKQVVAAARARSGVRVFIAQMEQEADVEAISFSESIARYWQGRDKAEELLVAALLSRYPLNQDAQPRLQRLDLETRFRDLALKACDIIDIANLPADDRHLLLRELELRKLYVALRLRVEIEAGANTTDSSRFSDMEKRRKLRWGAAPASMFRGRNLVSLGSRLQAARRLIVLGDPGSGKSTLLRWLATAYLLRLKNDPDWRDLPDVSTLPDASWVPILVRCRDLALSDCTLDDVLRNMLRKSEMGDDACVRLAAILREKLEIGSALLLIDGLDEISDPRARVQFAQQLEQIHRACPSAPVVVTSRIVGYREMGYRIGSGFEHLSVADLSPSDKDDFARRWCGLTERLDRGDEAATELIRDIHSNDRIERLTGNPMLLTTMALIKRKVGRLPQRRVDLYEKAVEVLLNWRSNVDRVALDRREALPQLEYLAHAMCSRGVQQLVEDEVLLLLQQVREEFPQLYELGRHSAREFLELLEASTGLLIQSGHARFAGRTVPVYEFRHLTIQEYLAGIALIQGHFQGYDAHRSLAENISPLAGEVSEPMKPRRNVERAVAENWREPLRLCIAAAPDKDVDAAILAVASVASGQDATARPRAVLAALCLADEPNVTPAIAETILQGVTEQLQFSADITRKLRIRSSLGLAVVELAASRWKHRLVSQLLAAYCASPLPRPTPYGALIGLIHCSGVSRQDEAAAVTLLDLLEGMLNGDVKVATEAALTLACLPLRLDKRIVSTSTISGLLDMLAAAPPTAQAAVWACENFALTHWWHPAKSELERLASLSLVGTLPQTVAPIVLKILATSGDSEVALPALLAGLTHSNPLIRGAAAVGLRRVPSPSAFDALLRTAKDENCDLGTRIIATEAIARIGTAASMAAAQEQMNDSNLRIRQAAFGASLSDPMEKVDRLLLRSNLTDSSMYVDPLAPITSARIRRASRVLKLPMAETRNRYRSLADRLGLVVEEDESEFES